MDNQIDTWAQGYFVDQPKYKKMSEEWKRGRLEAELFNVRPYPEGNSICTASDPEAAKWIAQRLNLASKLERMTYDWATGKTDGMALLQFVRRAAEGN